MKMLVYGAGVIGSYLAHVLCSAGHDVSLLARGKWKEELDANGLVIHHYRQKKTTIDHPRIVERLVPGEKYDAVFAVMQYQQMWLILDDLAACGSPIVVLVGNNSSAAEMDTYIRAHWNAPKTILFGFQATGGRRENGKVICVRFGDAVLKCGFLHSEPDETTKSKLSRMFSDTKYAASYYSDMDAWYKGHLALVLPVGYLCYRHGCDLKQVTGRQLKQAMTAIREGFGLLSALGYPILPDGTEAYFERGPKGVLCTAYFVSWPRPTSDGWLPATTAETLLRKCRSLTKRLTRCARKSPIFPCPSGASLNDTCREKKQMDEAGDYEI